MIGRTLAHYDGSTLYVSDQRGEGRILEFASEIWGATIGDRGP